MRLILLVSILIIFLIPVPTYAYNTTTAGVVIDTQDTGYNTPSYSDYATLDYIGINSSGNHVVFVANRINDTTSQFSTWEISPAGVIIGEIDSEIASIGMTDQASGLEKVHDSWDWYMFFGENYDTGAYRVSVLSFRISAEGAINLSSTGTLSAPKISLGGAHQHCKLFDNVILVSFYYAIGASEWRTYEIDAITGAFTELDDTGSTQVGAVLKTGGYDNDNWVRFATITSTKAINVWHVWGDDGTHTAGDFGGIVGSGTLTYLYGSADSLAFINYNDDLHAAFGNVRAADGVGGDPDAGLEIIQITNTAIDAATVVTTGTVCIENLSYSNSMANAMAFDNSISVLYNLDAGSFNKGFKMRTTTNIFDEPFTQDSVSDDLDIVGTNEIWYASNKNASICRLGDSYYTATVAVEYGTADVEIFTIEHYIPPTVTTEDLMPLMTAYNTAYDGALWASGSCSSIGNSVVTEYGFVYDTLGYPDYSDNPTATSGTQEFPFNWNETILDLDTAALYYVRAYAASASGTGYGEVLSSYSFPEYANTILRLTFEPLEISSGTVSDISGYDHDMYFTLGSFGTLTIDYEFGLTGETYALIRDDEDIVSPSPNEGDWTSTDETMHAEDNPFYPIVEAISDMTTMDVLTVWYFFYIAIMLGFALFVQQKLGQSYLTAITAFIITIVFWLWGPIPMWVLFFHGLISAFIIYKDSGVSFGRSSQ